MENIKDYREYESLFKDDLVVAVRNVLEQIEDPKFIKSMDEYWTMEDSDEHNALIEYFNKFALHKKISKKEFENWKK